MSVIFDFGKIVTSAIEFFLENIIDGFFSLLAGLMVNISSSAVLVLELELVKQSILYSQAICGTIVAAKIAFEAFQTYMLRQSGDPDSDPGGLLIRAAQSIAIISAVPWLVRQMYLFGSGVANDISRLPGVGYEAHDNALKAMWEAVSVTNPNSVALIAIGVIFAIVMIVIIIVQSFIRAGELAVIAATGAWMALSLTNQNSGLFQTWWKELLAISMTQAIQIFLVKLAFSALQASGAGITVTNNPITNLLLFMGILWVTIKAPSVLRSFLHSTGTGRVAGQAGSMVIMRAAMRGGR